MKELNVILASERSERVQNRRLDSGVASKLIAPQNDF